MERPHRRLRIAVLPLIAIGIVALYITRLGYLQLVSTEYKERAMHNALYEEVIFPDRGVIYDRKGTLLVYNEPAYDLLVTTKELADTLDTPLLASLLHTTEQELDERMTALRDRSINPGYSPFTPQLFWSQLTNEEAGFIQEQLFRLPGFTLRPRAVRRSDQPNAALLLGYLGESSPEELKADSTLALGQYVGKSGVERTYDKLLRGHNGVNLLLRDARGRIQGSYNEGADDIEAIPGEDLTLSIDIGLQSLGEKLMQGKRGAIVMIEPKSGEVLCLVSSPTYDVRMLQGKSLGKAHQQLILQEGKPLFNRAIMGTYPPGSTFKPAMGAVMLQEHLVTTSTLLSCARGYPRMRGRPACHGHASPLNLRSALTTSCNAYFCWGLHFLLDDRSRYPSVQDALNKWRDYMVNFGFGYKLGIDLAGENRGFIPNSSVYDRVYSRWNSSTIISLSIGQGEVLLTPLQMANLASIIANRGYYYTPHVVRKIEHTPLDTLFTTPHHTMVSPDYWEEIAQGMHGAVLAGTCRRANFAPGEINVCGKTGTAENRFGKDHSAFIGFAPLEEPKVAISVYVENGGFGAIFGVPIGRVMMEYYLRDGQLSGASQAIAEQISRQKIFYSHDL